MAENSASDPFGPFKAAQRESWAGFAVNELFTTPPAAALVKFAGVGPHEKVLDVGCGTGVVAVTAARAGAHVKGLDLTPALLDRARENAALAEAEIEFTEGDAEALPYADGSFDVVLSQFGHMFAPRPKLVTAEMLRVLKPGGRIAFSTWPPEHNMGRLFALIARNLPQAPAGAPTPADPTQWGDPHVIRDRLGDAVTDLRFDRAIAINPALSPLHARASMEANLGPIKKVLQGLHSQPDRAAQFRAAVLELFTDAFLDNTIRQQFLMTRAIKR